MEWVSVRVLKYFLMVAREENITKAAALLHITQPTLSRQLMQLEEELGVKLFYRSKHSIILTEDGWGNEKYVIHFGSNQRFSAIASSCAV